MEIFISKEAASTELNSWLDFQEISEDTRKAYLGNINIIIRGIQYGKIIIDPKTNILTQKLRDVIGKEITELKYKATGLEIAEVENNKSNINLNNEDRNELAHVAVATNTSTDILMKMSVKDFNNARAIVVFFMVT